MYERFTDRARKVMQLANQQAQRWNHEYIGTEHLLMGILKEGNGVGANVIKDLVNEHRLTFEIERLIQIGQAVVSLGKLPQTPRAKKVLEHAMDEARALHHNYVGTEHLLLGVIRDDENVARQVLANCGAPPDVVRARVMEFLGKGSTDNPDLSDELTRLRGENAFLQKTIKEVRELAKRICTLTEGTELAVTMVAVLSVTPVIAAKESEAAP